MSTTDALVTAWERWDARPGSEHESKAFHAAVRVWAAEHSIDPLRARVDLIKLKRRALAAGETFDRAAALRAVATGQAS